MSISDPGDVAPLGEEHGGLEPPAREVVVGERRPALERVGVVDLLGPPGVGRDERALGDLAVPLLELLDVVELDHRVRVGARALANVDDDDRGDQLPRLDVGREPAAGMEVAGDVHVRARVLAERPLLRVEAVRRIVGDRLALRLLAGDEDREIPP